MKKLLVLLAALTMALTMALPASSITNGEPTTDHSEVVLILMEVDDDTAYRCSGTLIEDGKYVVTAGHCTSNFPDPEYRAIRIFTEADVDNGNNNYPDAGPNSVEAIRWAAHPLYDTAPFWFNDVGMIELEKAVTLDPGHSYGTLPDVDSLDEYAKKRGQNKVRFESVGYGLQRINPVFVEADRERYVAYPKLNAINAPGMTGDFSLLLSNNHSTGGTCFGDSGGPNFLKDTTTIAGVTSFGLNGNCAGTGGVFRLDRQNVLDFIDDFMNP